MIKYPRKWKRQKRVQSAKRPIAVREFASYSDNLLSYVVSPGNHLEFFDSDKLKVQDSTREKLEATGWRQIAFDYKTKGILAGTLVVYGICLSDPQEGENAERNGHDLFLVSPKE